MDVKQIIMLALQLSILCTVLGFGLNATLADIVYLFRHPGLLIRSLLAVYVLMPLVVVGLDAAFDFRPPVEILLVALSISPLPPLLPRKEAGIDGQVSYGLGLMALLAIVSIVAVPLSLRVLPIVFDKQLTVDTAAIAGVVVKSTLAPLLVGVVIRRRLPAFARRIEKPVRMIGNVLLPAAVLVLVAGSLSAIWSAVGDGTVFAMAIVTIAGLAIGHFLGGPEPSHSVVLALSTACRHPAIAVTIAAASYPNHPFGGMILLYLLVNALVAIPYLKWQDRPSAAGHAAPSPPAVRVLK
jgi:bile acid:Na+ symporter, BASS family